MDTSQLKSIIGAEISNALGTFTSSSVSGKSKTSSLSAQREKAMDYYLGQPFGNEQEGRSQVVSTDVQDTIEWIMPTLIRIFTASDKAVVFEPFGPEDEEQAEQETDYTNYVFYKENSGFLIFYSWFKDALLLKNGYVKIYPEEYTKSSVETYKGLSDQEFNLLITDEELEPIEHSEYQSVMEIQGQQIPIDLHDLKVRRTSKEKKICVIPVPPDEILVSRKTLSIDINSAPFVAHRCKKTISDLVQMGYDKKTIESAGSSEYDTTQERTARFSYDMTSPDEGDTLDSSLKEVWVNECYMTVDFDGDGIAELRKIVMVGNEILENEETDIIPVCAITPMVLTHKHHGLSVADTMSDLQLIRSTMLRQMLDNMYLANNQRTGAVEGRVNLDDLLESRVGGIVRMKDPNAIVPIPFNPIPPQTFSLFELTESIKENRTGVTRYNQGTDANSLNKTATGVNQIMSASQQRVDLIARVFAETGVKDLFIKLHGMLIKYSDKQKIVKLRNKYVQVDPREWRERFNVSIAVALGTGNKEQTVTSLVTILNLQKETVASGGMGTLITPQNIHHAQKELVEAMGFKNGELFFADPSMQPPPPPPPPDPQLVMIQTQKAIEDDKRKVDVMGLQQKEKDDQRDAQLEAMKIQIQAMLAGVKAENDKMKALTDVQMKNLEAQLRQMEAVISERDSQRNLQMQEEQHVGKMTEMGFKAGLDERKMQHQQKMEEKKQETLRLPKNKPK